MCSWEGWVGDKLKVGINLFLEVGIWRLFVKAVKNQRLKLIFRIKSFCDKHLISREKSCPLIVIFTHKALKYITEALI